MNYSSQHAVDAYRAGFSEREIARRWGQTRWRVHKHIAGVERARLTLSLAPEGRGEVTISGGVDNRLLIEKLRQLLEAAGFPIEVDMAGRRFAA